MTTTELDLGVCKKSSFEQALFDLEGTFVADDEFFLSAIRLSEIEKRWLNKFSGHIPKSWGDTKYIGRQEGIVRALQVAGESGIELSDILKLAAVTHPDSSVVEEVTVSQPLGPKLLTAVFLRGHNDELGRVNDTWANDIYKMQVAKGVLSETIIAARAEAEEYVRNRSQRESRRSSRV